MRGGYKLGRGIPVSFEIDRPGARCRTNCSSPKSQRTGLLHVVCTPNSYRPSAILIAPGRLADVRGARDGLAQAVQVALAVVEPGG
jgi:hypothetical protein